MTKSVPIHHTTADLLKKQDCTIIVLTAFQVLLADACGLCLPTCQVSKAIIITFCAVISCNSLPCLNSVSFIYEKMYNCSSTLLGNMAVAHVHPQFVIDLVLH